MQGINARYLLSLNLFNLTAHRRKSRRDLFLQTPSHLLIQLNTAAVGTQSREDPYRTNPIHRLSQTIHLACAKDDKILHG